MASIINASTTSTSGLIQTADASGVLQLQSNGVTGLTVDTGGNVTVNTNLYVSGAEIEPLVLATAKTASGTSVDFTGIPSWVKRITVSMSGVSAAATATAYIRIGTGGALATTGYNGVTVAVSAGTPGAGTNTVSIAQATLTAAASRLDGQCMITKLDGNTWTSMSVIGRSGSETIVQSSAGSITLGGTLDIVGLVLSASTFDAGIVNIMYE